MFALRNTASTLLSLTIPAFATSGAFAHDSLSGVDQRQADEVAAPVMASPWAWR